MTSQSGPTKQTHARSNHRANNYTRSSIRELTDKSLLSWTDDEYFEGFLDQKLLLLSINSKNGINIFGLSENDFQQKFKKLINIVIYETPQSSFLIKENDEFKILISNETLQKFQKKMEQLFGVKLSNEDINGTIHTKACAGVQLLSAVLGLRLYKEIKDNKIRLPVKEITKEEAISEFRKLKSFSATATDEVSFSSSTGNKAVDFFTLRERMKAGVAKKKSIHELWYNNPKALVGSMRMLFNSYFEQQFKKNGSIDFSSLGIENKGVAKFLTMNNLVSMFSPSTFMNLISLLQRKYQFTFHEDGYVCDPCGGWGGREVGALAHPKINHITLVEPNSDLIPLYHDMHQLYASNKQLVAINKKIEDVSLEELKQNGHENDLAFTSPPYKDKEIYATSKRDYADDANWQELLFKLLKTADSLRPGGMLVLNVCANLFSDVIENYKENNKLQKFAHLNFLGQVKGTNRNRYCEAKTELLVIFRREAGGALELPWQQPLPKLAYMAIDVSNELTFSAKNKLRATPKVEQMITHNVAGTKQRGLTK